ncbi:hypothetical protein [Demequina aestuarii]|uniref:hypothetical protein n=1 Tax=Demequina aestuarii TaxID=327095 RepID=UPI0007855068|nr:hypothetical protein [Demequina aestuarii]
MIESLQEFAASFPAWAQWFAVALVSAIPFVESYFGSVIGVAIGLHPGVAIGAAVAGNVVSMVAFVYAAHAVRRRNVGDEAPSARRVKLKAMFDRYGVPGVSLLGQTMLPSQITAGAMVGFGASRTAVTGWQVLSIILWGAAFGLIAAGLISV